MTEHDASESASHGNDIQSSPCQGGIYLRSLEPAFFRPWMVSGVPFQRVTVRFADGQGGVEAPDGPSRRPGIEPEPWRRRGRRDRRDAGTWRRSTTRRCDA